MSPGARWRTLAFAAGIALGAVAMPSAAALIVFSANLSGPAESPPNASAGIGSTTVTVDTVLNQLFVSATFSGLTGNTTASHIHCCTAVAGTANSAVATELPSFSSLPLGVKSGSITETYNLLSLSTYNPAFVTANGGTAASAEAALIAGMLAGKSYLNIHSSAFPAGEIRGFLTQVPEPGSLALLAAGLVGFGATRRRQGA